MSFSHFRLRPHYLWSFVLCCSFTTPLTALFYHGPPKASTEERLKKKIFDVANKKVHLVAFKRVASSVDTNILD